MREKIIGRCRPTGSMSPASTVPLPLMSVPKLPTLTGQMKVVTCGSPQTTGSSLSRFCTTVASASPSLGEGAAQQVRLGDEDGP